MISTKTGIALTGFAAVFALLALTPASASFLDTNNADSPVLFGMAELTHKNADGDIIASQTVHNRLLNTGEAILIDGAFDTLAANSGPRLICITDNPTTVITENTDVPAEEQLVAANFDYASGFANSTDNTCVLADIDTDTDASIAEMTATFYGSGNATTPNLNRDSQITHLAICNQADSTALFTDCDAAGEVFSAVAVSNTPVGASDSVEVTYTFDLTSDSD